MDETGARDPSDSTTPPSSLLLRLLRSLFAWRGPNPAGACRRAAGWARLAAWLLLLWAVMRPWSELGGLVGERLRWFARVLPWCAAVLGLLAGAFARDACGFGGTWTHARWLRPLVWTPLTAVAVALVVATGLGEGDIANAIVATALAWCAGTDVALAAWPLVRGDDYRFSGPVDLAGIGGLDALDDREG